MIPIFRKFEVEHGPSQAKFTCMEAGVVYPKGIQVRQSQVGPLASTPGNFIDILVIWDVARYT